MIDPDGSLVDARSSIQEQLRRAASIRFQDLPQPSIPFFSQLWVPAQIMPKDRYVEILYRRPWPEPWWERDLRKISEEQDPFVIMAHATVNEGIYVEVPDGMRWTLPVEMNSEQRWHIYVGKHAKVHLELEAKQMVHMLLSLQVDLGGHISVTHKHQGGFVSALSERTVLGQDALYDRMYVVEGSAYSSLQVDLAGDRAALQYKSLLKAGASDYAQESLVVNHEAEQTRSAILHKAVLGGSAMACFSSVGRLSKQSTTSRSHVHHLVIDGAPGIEARPIFEIGHDRVEASHGCTIANLDENLLLYTRSRGIERSMAQQLIVDGFCSQVSDAQF